VQALTEKIQQEPRNALLYLQRGELQRHLEHWDLAKHDLDRAEQLDRNLTAVHLSRALLLMESGRPDDALRSVDRFLTSEPKRADAHETRGRILFRLGRLAESEGAFSKAIELIDYPTPDLYLARLDVILARGPAFRGQALDSLDEGIARLGPIVTLELAAIELERCMKNWDGALRRVERLARVSPRQESWLVRRGDILSEAGRNAEARAAYAQALEAIESLPERYRTAPATKKLEVHAQRQLRID
jgi:tetratricopeptide (TPR) repeat protein